MVSTTRDGKWKISSEYLWFVTTEYLLYITLQVLARLQPTMIQGPILAQQ